MNCAARQAHGQTRGGKRGTSMDSNLAKGMRASLRNFPICSFSTLIVALCATAVPNSLFAQGTAEDLSGRWTSQRHSYVLDISRCGPEWCGIKLNADRSCGAVALRLAPVAAAEPLAGRFTGTLILDPAARTYKVRAAPGPDGASRPQEIHLSGNPDFVPTIFTRSIPFQDLLVRASEPTCRTERKVS
jgi:hypothetical protein